MSKPLPAPLVQPLATSEAAVVTSNGAGSTAAGAFIGTMSLSTPPPTPKPFDFPGPSSPSQPAPEETVRAVLSHLLLHHPNLGAPSLSDQAKFLEKARQLPGLPEWMWYGMLHYAVAMVGGDGAVEGGDDGCVKEVVDFGILDDLLGEGDLQGPGRLWGMTFYYMFLHLEGGRRCSAASSAPPSSPSSPSSPSPSSPSSPPSSPSSSPSFSSSSSPPSSSSPSPSPPSSNEGEIEEGPVPKAAPTEINRDEDLTGRRQTAGPERGKAVWIPSLNSLLMVFLLAMVSVVAGSFLCGFPPDFRYAYTYIHESAFRGFVADWAHI
jgi:hypothetical protein